MSFNPYDWLKDWHKPDNRKLLDKMKKKTKNARIGTSDTFQ